MSKEEDDGFGELMHEEAKQYLTDLTSTPFKAGEADDIPDGAVRPEELIRMREEAERIVDETLRLYETSFSKLPALTRLRVLWKERKIESTDPIWLMVEALTLNDSRGQLQFSQIVRLFKANEEMSRYTAQELRQVVMDAMQLREAIVPLTEAMEENTEETRKLTKHLAKFSELAPELLELVGTAIHIQGKNNRLNKWEQALIYAACTGVGFAIATFFRR
jgi:hypothetical protein